MHTDWMDRSHNLPQFSNMDSTHTYMDIFLEKVKLDLKVLESGKLASMHM